MCAKATVSKSLARGDFFLKPNTLPPLPAAPDTGHDLWGVKRPKTRQNLLLPAYGQYESRVLLNHPRIEMFPGTRKKRTIPSLTIFLAVFGLIWRPANAQSETLPKSLEIEGAQKDATLQEIARQHANAVLEKRGASPKDLARRFANEGLAEDQALPFVALGNKTNLMRSATIFFSQNENQGYTHYAYAFAREGEISALVALLVRRLVSLMPLPKRVSANGIVVRGRSKTKSLRSLLLGPCSEKQCPPTAQNLSSQRRGNNFSVRIGNLVAGSYVFEIIADVGRGPEVATLWKFRVPEGNARLPNYPRANASRAYVNLLRNQERLAPLVMSQSLARAARRHAVSVCKLGRSFHVLHQKTPDDRARVVGHKKPVLENIALANSETEAMRMLLQSPSHRSTLYARETKSIGIGTAQHTDQFGSRFCLVQMFGVDDQLL